MSSLEKAKTNLVTLHDQLKCAQRELNLRRRVYPSWIARGKMSGQKADHEIAAMEAIVDTLSELMEQRGQTPPPQDNQPGRGL